MLRSLSNPQSLRIIDSLLGGERSLEEIASSLRMSKPNIKQKYLDGMERTGLIEKTIVKTKVGRQARYRLMPITVIFSIDPRSGSAISFTDRSRMDPERLLLQQVDPDFRGDLYKLFDALDRRALDGCVVILYGSVAVGKGVRKSDIDLLFLKDSWEDGDERVKQAVDAVSLDVGHQISPVFLTKEEFINKDKVFFKEVKKDGIVLWGGLEEDGAIWRQMRRYSSIST